MWQINSNNYLYRDFIFPDFVSAFGFVTRVSFLAEKIQHHPEINLTWGKVSIITYTHSTNSLTDKDYELAREIDKMAKELGL